jgi:signal transduction histidine kinase
MTPLAAPGGGRRDLVEAAGELEAVSGDLERRYRELRARLAAVVAASETSRGRLERTLAEKERLSRLLDGVLENIDAAVILRGPSGLVLAANGASRSMGAVHERDGEAPRLHPALEEVPEGAVDHPVELTTGGGPRHWEVRLRPVDLPDLGPGELCIVRDVSRRVELESVARRRSSLEALGRMAAEVAHEVRNPLGSLELCASMLRDDLAGDGAACELAEQILLGVRQLSGTVTRLLGSVRAAGRRRRSARVDQLVGEVAEFVAPVARSREVRIELETDSEVVAPIDPDGVRQVLLNLLGNALDVTPRGGRVSLSVREETGSALVTVVDDGPGVPASEREKIFEAFYSTRPDGTGLGLSVAERIVLDHGGRIRVDCAEGRGARFRVELPCGRPAAAESEEAEP